MTTFREERANGSPRLKELMDGFSFQPIIPSSYHSKEVIANSWGSFVSENVQVDVRCDLTFRKCVEEIKSAEWIDDVCIRSATRNKTYITDAIAYETIRIFCDRLNYASYKHAYKRYGKRLNCVSAIEGGDADLRENCFFYDKDKRLHTHLLLQRPTHIDFDTFVNIINRLWIKTIWGDNEMQLEDIRTIKKSAKYNAKSTMDNVDFTNTYYNNLSLCN